MERAGLPASPALNAHRKELCAVRALGGWLLDGSACEAIWHEAFGGDAWEAAHHAGHTGFVEEVLRLKAEESEKPFEEVLGPNLRGLYHVYEAARREGARVIFASSNHSIGFHERPAGNAERLDHDCAFRPDGYYGLSKAYGELMGRMYWDKHGVENVNLRIGSCFPKPIDRRMLSTWLSYADLTRLCERCVLAERAGHAVIWACSDNPASYWGKDQRERIGWAPQDSAEPYRAEVEHITADPVTERYQGGGFPAMEYSRATPSPRDPWSLED